jgi:hypothetical protein
MKKLLYLSILCIGIVFTSCDVDENIETEDSIIGSWSMTEASLGLAGYQTFEVNQIVWTFNNDNQMYVYLQDSLIINPNIPYSTVDGAGYDFTSDSSTIIINDVGYNLAVNETELIIGGNVAADGTQLTFIRN